MVGVCQKCIGYGTEQNSAKNTFSHLAQWFTALPLVHAAAVRFSPLLAHCFASVIGGGGFLDVAGDPDVFVASSLTHQLFEMKRDYNSFFENFVSTSSADNVLTSSTSSCGSVLDDQRDDNNVLRRPLTQHF